jgi:hypothetical protein
MELYLQGKTIFELVLHLSINQSHLNRGQHFVQKPLQLAKEKTNTNFDQNLLKENTTKK